MVSLKDLEGQGWKLALCKSCMTCGGTGRVKKNTAAYASLMAGYYGSSEHDNSTCGSCLNGFIFAPLDPQEALTVLLEGFLARLENPESHVLRKRFLDLYITDTELRMAGKAP